MRQIFYVFVEILSGKFLCAYYKHFRWIFCRNQDRLADCLVIIGQIHPLLMAEIWLAVEVDSSLALARVLFSVCHMKVGTDFTSFLIILDYIYFLSSLYSSSILKHCQNTNQFHHFKINCKPSSHHCNSHFEDDEVLVVCYNCLFCRSFVCMNTISTAITHFLNLNLHDCCNRNLSFAVAKTTAIFNKLIN